MEGIGVGIAVAIVLFMLVFLWGTGRRVYFWTAAKIFGWSEDEKFERETARFRRAMARDERLAKKDAAAATNTGRKWQGVTFATVAFAFFAYRMDVPWWESGMAVVAFAAGLVMAAGLAWRWYS